MSKITLPAIFQNHMMLQREKPIYIWGECSVSAKIRIVFAGTETITESKDGAFGVYLPAVNEGEVLTLSIYLDEEETPDLTLTDITLGDIWIASGQSNMEYFLRYDAHWNETRQQPFHRDIRMFNVPRIAFAGQERTLPDSGYWFFEQDEAWSSFSAPGYYFARNLEEDLHIPVGVIGCNWGGTPACAWMDESYLAKEPLHIWLDEYKEALASCPTEQLKAESLLGWEYEDDYHHQLEWRSVMYGLSESEQKEWELQHSDEPLLPMGPYHHYRPCGLYQTMVLPIAPFTIKGILWYQGESDSNHPQIYDTMMCQLIQCWRDTFHDPDLPFLFVQIAPFEKWLTCTGENYPVLRDRQDWVSQHVPHTAMASINDIGMYEDIHPKEKREVGRRLALLAEHHVYSCDVPCEAPRLRSATRVDDTITLTFDHAYDGLTLSGDTSEISALSITQDGVPLVPSSFDVAGDIITLSFAGLSGAPVCLRFAKTNYYKVNLYNSAGIPALPFEWTVR